MGQQILLTKVSTSAVGCTAEAKKAPASRGYKRRTELLKAAEYVFIENGFRNTTMSDIAAHANASKASLYKFFGNKEELYSEIVNARVPDIKQLSETAIQPKQNLADTLKQWCLEILEQITSLDTIALYKALLVELPLQPKFGDIYQAQGPEATKQQLATFFHQATRSGQLNCPNPDLAATLFSSMTIGDPFNRALLGSLEKNWMASKAEEHVTEAVAVFLARYAIAIDKSTGKNKPKIV